MRHQMLRDGETSTMRPAWHAARGARTWAPVLLATAVAALSAAGCTCEGCGDTFHWSAQLPPDVEVRSLSVRSCYNGRCVQASLATVDEDHLRGSGLELVQLRDPADPEASTGASVMLSRSADALELEVSWYVHAPVDGDRYLVEVADAEGTVLVGFAEQPIDYRSYPVNTLVTYCHTASVTGSTVDAARPDGSASP